MTSTHVTCETTIFDVACPICHAEARTPCTPRWEGEESAPTASGEFAHRTRATLANYRREERDWASCRAREKKRTREKMVALLLESPASFTDVDRLLLSLEARVGDWPLPEVDAVGIFTVRTRLFMPGDPVLLSFTNGGGERAGMVGWSTKKRCAVGPTYVKFSACQYVGSRETHSYAGESYVDHPKNVEWVELPNDLKQRDEGDWSVEPGADPLPLFLPAVRELVTQAVEGCRRAFAARR